MNIFSVSVFSINDPGIWRVKCVPGREMMLVRSVLLKALASRVRGRWRKRRKERGNCCRRVERIGGERRGETNTKEE